MLPACSSFQNLCESLIDLILNTHPTSATAAIASGGARNGQQSFINSLILFLLVLVSGVLRINVDVWRFRFAFRIFRAAFRAPRMIQIKPPHALIALYISHFSFPISHFISHSRTLATSQYRHTDSVCASGYASREGSSYPAIPDPTLSHGLVWACFALSSSRRFFRRR